MTIYEKLMNLIPEVKTLENEDTKKRLTFKIRDIMDQIKLLNEEYENLDINEEKNFFLKKQQMEENLSILINEIESAIQINNEEVPNKTI